MWIADREQRARHRHREVHHRALANAPIVDIAAEISGWDRIDEFRLARRNRDDSKMRPHRNAHALQDPVVFLVERMIDRHSGVVYDRVHYANRICRWSPALIVYRRSPVESGCRAELID